MHLLFLSSLLPDGVATTGFEIANAAIEAAKAGAAVVHIHVRDPETGKGSRDPKLFRETVVAEDIPQHFTGC